MKEVKNCIVQGGQAFLGFDISKRQAAQEAKPAANSIQ